MTRFQWDRARPRIFSQVSPQTVDVGTQPPYAYSNGGQAHPITQPGRHRDAEPVRVSQNQDRQRGLRWSETKGSASRGGVGIARGRCG